MIKAAESIIKDFAIKQNRYNPPIAAVKEAIDKGVLGKIIVFN
jgi:predicted dehydrogenase